VPWCYTHVGVELALDHKRSPFLKDTLDPACFHDLEAHLHLLDGYVYSYTPRSEYPFLRAVITAYIHVVLEFGSTENKAAWQ
jgi:hypothetical protein